MHDPVCSKSGMGNYLRAARRSGPRPSLSRGMVTLTRAVTRAYCHNTSLRVEMEVTVTVMSRKSHHSSMDVNLNSSCKIHQNLSFLLDSPSELAFYAYKDQAYCFGYYTFVASTTQVREHECASPGIVALVVIFDALRH